VQVLHFVKPHDINKLREELEAQGVVILDLAHTEEEIWIGIPDDAPQSMIDTVNAVVAAHDPTPPPPPKTPQEILMEKLTAIDFDTPTAIDELKAELNELKAAYLEYLNSISQ
jgi:hypothetical protein